MKKLNESEKKCVGSVSSLPCRSATNRRLQAREEILSCTFFNSGVTKKK